MIACPSCPRHRRTEAELVAHLMNAHGLTIAQATDRARLVVRDVERMARRVAKKGKA